MSAQRFLLQFVDGRNRLAACKIAKVKPTFAKLDGKDPLAYVVSANLARRNLTKGQQAMALAFIYPEPGSRTRKEAAKAAETSGFSTKRLREARSILRHSRELAQAVLKGVTPLDEALDTVKAEEQRASSAEAKHGRLRAAAPDLADRVADEKLTLDEAYAIWLEREKTLRDTRQAGRAAIDELEGFCGDVISIQSAIEAGEELRISAGTFNRVSEAYKLLTKIFKGA